MIFSTREGVTYLLLNEFVVYKYNTCTYKEEVVQNLNTLFVNFLIIRVLLKNNKNV